MIDSSRPSVGEMPTLREHVVNALHEFVLRACRCDSPAIVNCRAGNNDDNPMPSATPASNNAIARKML